MRRSAVLGVSGAALALCGLGFACGGLVVLGDDTPRGVDAAPGPSPDPARPDATPDATPDANPADAEASTCEAKGGTCTPPGALDCRQIDTTGLSCAASGQLCCLVSCPKLTPPPPASCDGGSIAPLYAADGCVAGFDCAPVSCVTAGGACVPLVPGSCASGNVGSATTYSCGGGLGISCCLP